MEYLKLLILNKVKMIIQTKNFERIKL